MLPPIEAVAVHSAQNLVQLGIVLILAVVGTENSERRRWLPYRRGKVS